MNSCTSFFFLYKRPGKPEPACHSLSVRLRRGQVTDGGQGERAPVHGGQVFSGQRSERTRGRRVDPVSDKVFVLWQEVVEAAKPVRQEEEDVDQVDHSPQVWVPGAWLDYVVVGVHSVYLDRIKATGAIVYTSKISLLTCCPILFSVDFLKRLFINIEQSIYRSSYFFISSDIIITFQVRRMEFTFFKSTFHVFDTQMKYSFSSTTL